MYSYSDLIKRYKEHSTMSDIEGFVFYVGLDNEAKEKYQKISLDDLTDHIQSILSKEIVFELEFYLQRNNRKIRAIKNKYPKSNIRVALVQHENEIIDDFHKIPVTISDMFERKESLGEEFFRALSVEVVRYIDNLNNYIERLTYITEIRQIYKKYHDSYHEYLAMMAVKKEKPSLRLHELFKDIHQYDQLVKVLKSKEVIDEMSGFENQYEFNSEFLNQEGLSTAKAAVAIAYIIFLNQQLNKKNKSLTAEAMRIFLTLNFSNSAFNKSWNEFINEVKGFKDTNYGKAFFFLFK